MCEEITEIVVKKRTHDYMAFVEGHTDIWGSGRDPDDAIGDLVRSHQNRFCVHIRENDKKIHS